MDSKKRKEQIRKKLLQQRRSIPEDQYLRKSSQICERLKEQPFFKQAHTIHCYVSMNDRREINTHPLIKEILDAGKRVIVPITEFESGTMRHIELEEFDRLNKNKWGVLEPGEGSEVRVKELDLVIVPMVGGDRHRNRIGYGKGFYDRFLAEVNCPAAGLLYEATLLDEIPTEPFDIRLNRLVTEQEIL